MADKHIKRQWGGGATDALAGIVAVVKAAVTAVAELITDHGTLRTTLGTGILRDPGLRIDGGSGAAVAEAQNAFHALVGGTLVLTAAGTNMPALDGTVSNGEFGIYVWEIADDGTITQLAVATGATLADITFPTLSTDKALVGAVIVNPTGTGDFVGGTTNLDDATVVPNAVFIDGSDAIISAVPAALAAATPDTLVVI